MVACPKEKKELEEGSTPLHQGSEGKYTAGAGHHMIGMGTFRAMVLRKSTLEYATNISLPESKQFQHLDKNKSLLGRLSSGR